MDTPDKLNVREEMDKERDELLELLTDRLLEETKAVTQTCEELQIRSLPKVLKAWKIASAYTLEQQLAQITESSAMLMVQLQASGVKKILTPVAVIGMDEYLATGNEALIEKQLAEITHVIRMGARSRLVLHQATQTTQTPPADDPASESKPDGKDA